MCGISWLAVEILVVQEGPSSLEFEREMPSYINFRRWFRLDRKSAELVKALLSGGVRKEKACHSTVDSTARQCVGMKVRLPWIVRWRRNRAFGNVFMWCAVRELTFCRLRLWLETSWRFAAFCTAKVAPLCACTDQHHYPCFRDHLLVIVVGKGVCSLWWNPKFASCSQGPVTGLNDEPVLVDHLTSSPPFGSLSSSKASSPQSAIYCFLFQFPVSSFSLNPLKPNDLFMRRTAQLTSRCCILYIYSTNIRTEYFNP